MTRLIGMASMAVITYYGLQWLGENVICEILAEMNMAGLTGSVTGVIAFVVMGLLMTVVCFKS